MSTPPAVAAQTTAKSLLERIKLDVLATGVTVTPDAMEWLTRTSAGPLSVHEYPTTGGLTLELPEQVYVNAPFDEWYCGAAVVTLGLGEDGLLLEHVHGGSVPVVRVLPLPGYLGTRDAEGRLVTDVAMSHADRVRLSPLTGCAYDCTFCDLHVSEYVLHDPDQLVAAMHAAASDDVLPVRHVLLSGGSPRRRHYEQFEAAIGTVADACRSRGLPIDVMMSPTIDGTGILDRLVARGVNAFSINLELHSEEASRLHLRRKYLVTRDVMAGFITRAVELLGSDGAVRSLIIPGLEPVEETLAGIDWLASLGCWPVLSPFRPAGGTPAGGLAPPSGSDLRRILDGSRAIVASHNVAIGPPCVPCQHNTLTFPWDVPEKLRES